MKSMIICMCMGIDQKIVFKGVKILEASYYIQMKMSYNKVKKKAHDVQSRLEA